MKPKHTDIYGNDLKLPETNWQLFEQLIGQIAMVDSKGRELMNPFEVCKNLFELTAQYYNIKYVEEQVIRIKYEGRLIERRAELTARDELIASLTLSEEDQAKVKAYYDSIK